MWVAWWDPVAEWAQAPELSAEWVLEPELSVAWEPELVLVWVPVLG